uniref:MADF domain-containing protein n=1 Tax=Anopheles stephensi TaxID=30069 RepID=A0A182Y3W7_ANOST
MDESDTPTYSETKLIELIKRQPPVWNKHDSLYKNKTAEKTVWKEISNLLETDGKKLPVGIGRMQCPNYSLPIAVTILKKRWHSLRGQYRRELRSPRASKWKHFARLSFLSESMSPVNGSSPNFREDDDEDDPIRVERPQPARTSLAAPQPKEEQFEWAYASTTSPEREKKAPPPAPPQTPAPDVSKEGNHYFALSLVDILNSIPNSQQLAARLAVLNALKDFQQPQAETSLQAQAQGDCFSSLG